jgi:ABC-type spermidine/putrescine transport system permease subunit I
MYAICTMLRASNNGMNNSNLKGSKAIANIYRRLRTQEKAISFGFLFKAIPFLVAVIYLGMQAYTEMNTTGDMQYAITLIIVAVLVLFLIWVLYQNSMIRATLVHAM